MSNLLIVTKVMFKSSFEQVIESTSSTSKRWKSLLLLGVIVMSLLPLGYMSIEFYKSLFDVAIPLQQEGYLFGVLILILSSLIMLFSFFQIPSIYYFAQDTETYLSLPLKPSEILGGKFLTTVIYEYSLVFLLYFPLLYTYLTYDFSFIKLFIGIVVGILLPFIPVLLASLIIILLMNFVPLFKNKNTITLLIGILAIAFSLGLNFALNSGDPNQALQTLEQLLVAGNNSMLNTLLKLFPFVIWAAKSITSASLLSLFFFIVLIIVLVILGFMFSQHFYLNGVTTINEGARSRKRFNQNQLKTNSYDRNEVLFMKREIKMLLRTPAYFLNLVLINVILPVLLILYVFVIPQENMMQDADFQAIVSAINIFLSNSTSAQFTVIVGGLLLGLSFSMMNMISITAISREGKGIDQLKVFPIRFWDILKGKMLVGILISITIELIVLIIITILFKINPLITLGIFIVSALVIYGYNALSIMIDALFPKLNWTNEIQAAKQNLNAITMMLFDMLLIGLLIFFIAKFYNNPFLIITVSLIIIIALSFFPTLYLIKKSNVLLDNINQG